MLIFIVVSVSFMMFELNNAALYILLLQIPAHLTTHSAKNWSVFPDVTERVSASADQ